ncbi:MAG TPA: DUF6265 family protein [Thermoanaerobaculia bacterium]|nr:DUF6265 family protein [Thermoanaerobaculia bacterium]
MPQRRTSALVAAAAVLATSVTLAGGSPPRPAPRAAIAASLADIAWLSGGWVVEKGETYSEEWWSAPSGDSMVGAWRLSISGRARLFELLTLMEEEGRVVLRIRHFDAKGVAWEEKDRPLVLPLVEKGTRQAVFEGTEGEGLLRISYLGDAESLTVEIAKTGKPVQSFRFLRAVR